MKAVPIFQLLVAYACLFGNLLAVFLKNEAYNFDVNTVNGHPLYMVYTEKNYDIINSIELDVANRMVIVRLMNNLMDRTSPSLKLYKIILGVWAEEKLDPQDLDAIQYEWVDEEDTNWRIAYARSWTYSQERNPMNITAASLVGHEGEDPQAKQLRRYQKISWKALMGSYQGIHANLTRQRLGKTMSYILVRPNGNGGQSMKFHFGAGA